MHRLIVILVLLQFTFITSVLVAQQVSWQVVDHAGSQVLQLDGIDHAGTMASDALDVFVGATQEWPGASKSSILGKLIEQKSTLLFQPTFPFRKEVTYTAFWNRQHAFTFTIASSAPATELLAIYPTATSLPANLLKLYLHFSAPMGEGRAYEHLTLVHSAGDTIHQPFVPLEPELWSADRKRLTLWLDPGRVKRGLLSHETHGVVIEPGQAYSLLIHPDWKDATGKKLGTTYQKSFQVVAPDYEKPQVSTWTFHLPRAGTLEPVSIDFGESLDQALASRTLSVLLDSGAQIVGQIVLEKEESVWHFYPEEPWKAEDYSIRVDSNLEDLAGNNLNRPFDLEMSGDKKRQVPQDFYTVHFHLETAE